MNLLLTMNIRKHHSYEDTIEHAYLDYFQNLGFYPIIISNRVNFKHIFSNVSFNGVVFTGGLDVSYINHPIQNEITNLRDSFEYQLLNYCIQHKIPILGICRGLQIINSYFGGTISKDIVGHINKEHSIIFNTNYSVFKKNQIISVNSFHNHGISKHNLSSELTALCHCTSDNLIEGVYHNDIPLLAIQWHPERQKSENPFINQMIKNFLIKS